ncbi:hypothetical protein SAMN05421787_101929 [Virgibacillus pantothenticus]|nr:hypothetical protein SAMN05421787_101929 [Virgibacillus pantothenticus]
MSKHSEYGVLSYRLDNNQMIEVIALELTDIRNELDKMSNRINDFRGSL